MLKLIRSPSLCINLFKDVTSIIERKYFSLNASFSKQSTCPLMDLKFRTSFENDKSIILNFQRNIFIYRSGDMLWEGVTGAPGRAKKRARGKRRVVRNKVDLNLGRKIGESSMHYKWPGLNAPIIEGKTMMKVEQGEKDDAYDAKIIEVRNRLSKRKVIRSVPPLKRGWSGSKLGGQSLGPPTPILGQKWEGYDTRILELKVVSTMTGSKGRYGRFSALVMVGNFQGLAGIGKGKSKNLRNALRIAKNKAINRFEYYELRDSRTLWHPDFVHDLGTKLYVRPMQEGHGLVCHRLLKTMCELIGIRDMYAKVEGSTTNYQVLARAFTALLRRQETYQALADRLRLNVVEIRSEFDNFPRLLAAPNDGVTVTPARDAMLDFDRLHVDGRVFHTKRRVPFYLSTPGPMHFAAVRHRFRNQEAAHRHRAVVEHLAGEGHLAKRPLPGNDDR